MAQNYTKSEFAALMSQKQVNIVGLLGFALFKLFG